MTAPKPSAPEHDHFLRAIIREDLRTNKHQGRVATRFPPEPNGYLHIGHAKSICLNFGLALEFGGTCNLRFDDTNPVTEDVEYVEAIAADVRWLGFSYGEKPLYASDYFGRMYELALGLIRDKLAYVCSLTNEQISEGRGTLTTPGTESPYRGRSVEENLELFERMNRGEFEEGTHVLRARIDMASPNMKMRDPLLYRIKRAAHHRTGTAWNVYPMYDYAHPLEDAFENITHSICTLEFENNRELYDWVLAATKIDPAPRQYEFARLGLDYTVMSKRKLLQLVTQKHVSGWDDPRMPTIAGMRRRGYTPEAIRSFCELIGVSKHNSTVDIGKLEYAVRDDLNRRVARVMGVLRPLPLTLTNYPEGKSEELVAPFYPAEVPRPEGAPESRALPFSRTVLIERDDFRDDPPKDYLRLAPGRTVRLRHGYCVRCDRVLRDEKTGEITGLEGTYFADTLAGRAPEGEKVWGVLHWVSAAHALACEVRLYDRLFSVAKPDAEDDFTKAINPASLERLPDARVEPALAKDPPGSRYQFERLGYFCVDTVDSMPGRLVFNRIVGLKDGWSGAKAQAPAAEGREARETREKEPREKEPKGDSRPGGRTKAHLRANARAADASLAARLESFQREHGLSADEADLLTASADVAELFEGAVRAGATARSVARWIINELPREVGEREVRETKLTGTSLGTLVQLADAGTLTGPAAKGVLAALVREGGDPRELAARAGAEGRLSDEDLAAVVRTVLEANPDKVAQFRGGKTGLLGFFVGQIVKATKGRAEPSQVQKALDAALK